MRSSKSRSRSKSGRNNNNNRSVGNVVNRVFDSSGPEGKVRGTPQQIIEKYNQLARDAQLSNDRVATENFQQHAEHYLRILAEATREQEEQRREQEARREQQERENRERQAERDREHQNRPPRHERQQGEEQPYADAQPQRQPDVLNVSEDASEDTGLVETPESARPSDEAAPKPKPKRTYNRKPKGPKPDAPEAAE